MAFDIEGARKAGYSETEIADHIAKTANFDAPKARQAGYSDEEIIKHLAPAPTMGDRIKQGTKDLAGGAVRGAGSIGATLLAPVDAAARALNSGKPVTVGGIEIAGQDRRAGMDGGLQAMGVDTGSMAFKGGKLAGEIAGTAGAGGAIANGVRAAAPALAAAPRVANLLQATQTAGFQGGGLASRAAGGAISGAASAGLVNPDDALAGAVVGGALPGAMKVAGAVGQKVGGVMRGPAQPADLSAAVGSARSAGYVIPPSQANPTLGNRLLEGFSGKLTTAQNASAKNQAVTNRLAAESLGLAGDAKITPDALATVRRTAGQAYDAIGQTGAIQAPAAYSNALDKIEAPFLKAAQGFPNAKPSPVIDLVNSLRSPTFDAAAAVEKIKQLRTAADDAFRTGNTDVARASKSAATALEDAIESHLQQIGQPGLLNQFKDARKLIAKTYTVEKALNAETGTVDARKLVAQLAKGKPLSGGLEDAARFAARFPKAAQAVEGMGSLPQTSPLDWAAGGTLSALTANPLLMAGVMARPAARSLVLSPVVQNRLVQSGAAPNALSRLLASPGLAQLGYRAAPNALADR